MIIVVAVYTGSRKSNIAEILIKLDKYSLDF